MRVREEHLSEMPRERLEQHGASVLSAAELIAIILGTGVRGEHVTQYSQRLLEEHGGLTGLMRLELAEIMEIPGLGLSKSTKLKAALELGRRLVTITAEDRPKIGAPEDVVRLFGIEMSTLEREQLRVVLLDTKHHVMSSAVVAQGTVNSANVRMAEVFSPAVRRMAPFVVLVHNHPTGDPTPSSADVQFTQEAVRAGNLLDIEVLDHIVIGQGRHASLKRLGLGFGASEES